MGDRRAFSMLVAMVVVAYVDGVSCRSNPYPSAIFPAKVSPTVLGIRDPILRPDLAVEAVVHGQDGTRATIWMLLDSGATIGSLPAAVATDLRLVEERHAIMIAINGVVRTSVRLVPRLELGELGVSNVAFLVNTFAGSVVCEEEMLEAVRAHDRPPPEKQTDPDEILTVEQVAHLLKVIPDTVRTWILSGALRARRPGNGMRPGRKYRVRRADLDAFVAASQQRKP